MLALPSVGHSIQLSQFYSRGGACWQYYFCCLIWLDVAQSALKKIIEMHQQGDVAQAALEYLHLI